MSKDDKPRIPADTIARRILRDHEIVRHDRAWFLWAGPKWREASDDEFHQLVYQEQIKIDKDHLPTNGTTIATKEAVRGRCRLIDEMRAAEGLLSFANGMLDLETGKMSPHDARHMNVNAFPYDYDPDAPEPEQWLAFLDSLWRDMPECIEALRAWMRLNLFPDTSQQKLVHLLGPPRSGKGTIAWMMTEVVGAENICSPTMRSISRDFGLQSAVGKLSMILSEARLSSVGDKAAIMDLLLQIVGEDSIDINRKHKPVWHGVLDTRVTVLSNEPLNLPDDTGAFLSRLIVLPFTESFVGREDTTLKDRLATERGAVLKWVLGGGRLFQPKAGEVYREQQRESSSPLQAFLDDRTERGSEYSVQKEELYAEYRLWCGNNGHRPFAKTTFGTKLVAMGISPSRARGDGGRVPVYLGLRFPPDNIPF